ncbi:hypothetical protein CAR_c22670 [Carnobacterium sp. 17-4]|uniref:hypothetical protein n=1 Tax=Carnobacterium sp. (strain 17-4) TaxID=208596 RepID=UPI0002059190|nr:hypothetical protein [Carnobacterium sp. 17-4]AEB30924.1 hypothetical protein CAR_c22670 [Carnobacterium sp. 17-4]
MEEIKYVDFSQPEEQTKTKQTLGKDSLYEKIDVSVESMNKFIFGIVVSLIVVLGFALLS